VYEMSEKKTLELTSHELWLVMEMVDVFSSTYGSTIEKAEFFQDSCSLTLEEADAQLEVVYTKMVEASK
jgi:hypothetical protein